MSSSRTRRVAKEVADIHADTLSHIKAHPIGNGSDLTHLKGSFKGPPGTPYEGGAYVVDVRIPNDYPFRPPIMKFDTKIWHPNVSSQTVSSLLPPPLFPHLLSATSFFFSSPCPSPHPNLKTQQGAICLDTLSSAWSPVLTIKSALLSLQSLLSTPEPKDPQDAEVAGMLTRNPREFERVAHEWAVKYAAAPKKESGEGSGGNKTETKKEKKQRSKEEERAERARLYVFSPSHYCCPSPLTHLSLFLAPDCFSGRAGLAMRF